MLSDLDEFGHTKDDDDIVFLDDHIEETNLKKVLDDINNLVRTTWTKTHTQAEKSW